jgi:hypothetical protein
MAYDSGNGVTVLFGGFDGRDNLGDTWEWNGSAWARRATSGPSARVGHAMAYDSARGVTVLFGGGRPAHTEETWVWDGETWTLEQVVGLPGRDSPGMAYDSARGTTVLFGGTPYEGWRNETWEYSFVAAPCIRDPAWGCDGDVDGNEVVNPVDVGLVQAAFCTGGQCPDDDLCQYDMDCDGAINPVDAGIVQALFGTCDPPRDVCP